MKKYFEILKKCPLFEGISESDLFTMLHCLGARRVEFEKKFTVMAQGSATRYIGVVLEGAVQTEQTDYYGNRSIVGTTGASQVFAEEFACAGVSGLPVNIVAQTNASVMFIDCEHILHTCKNNCSFHNRLIYNLMRVLASKNVAFHQRLEVTSKRTTREKLLTFLMLCAENAGSYSFDIPYDRQQLADYLEVDRSGLSNEISKLRDEGVLESRKNHFKLLRH